ncbi:MAG: hypothetical protein V3S68_03520, partial [Dehalococcoidia bacterium]
GRAHKYKLSEIGAKGTVDIAVAQAERNMSFGPNGMPTLDKDFRAVVKGAFTLNKQFYGKEDALGNFTLGSNAQIAGEADMLAEHMLSTGQSRSASEAAARSRQMVQSIKDSGGSIYYDHEKNGWFAQQGGEGEEAVALNINVPKPKTPKAAKTEKSKLPKGLKSLPEGVTAAELEQIPPGKKAAVNGHIFERLQVDGSYIYIGPEAETVAKEPKKSPAKKAAKPARKAPRNQSEIVGHRGPTKEGLRGLATVPTKKRKPFNLRGLSAL